MGFSINTLTLFAIVLATGIVVDDAIVVIENIERHIQEYQEAGARRRPRTRCARCFGAVIATALVLIAVFVPVAFFPGTTGRLYQQFALTIAFCGRDLGVQRADADAGAVGAAAAIARTSARAGSSAHRARHHGGHAAPTSRRVGGLMRVRWAMVAGVHRAARRQPYCVYTARAAVVRARRRTPATSSPSCRRRPARRSSTPSNVTQAGGADPD